MFHQPPLDAVMLAMMEDAKDEIASIGWNLFHDRRIAPSRFAQFQRDVAASGATLATATSVEPALTTYFIRRVQESRTPDFLDPVANAGNQHAPGGLPALHGSKRLVSVLNLNRLGRVYAEAKDEGVAEFQTLDQPTKHGGPTPTVVEWLDRQLADLRVDSGAFTDHARLRRHPFLIALLAYMNFRRVRAPYEPRWVTTWERFHERAGMAPPRWQRLLGVKPSERDSWLLLLSYPVREAGRLVRPTQLEAGWYAEHFPASLSAQTGHPMELDAAWRLCQPLSEYIHQQIDHFPEHLAALARVPGCASTSVGPAQRRHLRVLKREYADTPRWIAHPHPRG